MVEFWTLGCYNCRNVEPYVKQWHERYAGQGLVVVGVHSPEFDYEKDLRRVEEYVRARDIRYPVVIDNDFAIWNRYANRYWPAMYLIDRRDLRGAHRRRRLRPDRGDDPPAAGGALTAKKEKPDG